MQSTASPSLTQTELLKDMQPQSAQNMFVPSSGTNSTGNVRTNQQTGTLYRGPPANSAPRSGARHVQMQPMYPPTLHQGVVQIPFTPFTRQAPFQQQYPYSQPMQPNFYSYHQYYNIQQPQAHQRGAVGVNTGVGSSMSVQTGPNGPLAGPPCATPGQIPLAAGTVITGAVPPGTNTVLGVATPTTGQQVGVPPMIGVGSSAVPSQSSQTKNPRRRSHALEIIDPNTKKNILEDLDLSKNSTNSEIDFQDQISSIPIAIQTELAAQQEHTTLGLSNSGVILMTTDTRPGLPYNSDVHQITQQRELVVGQTPVVSAMSDAPSVEILPTPHKPRSKKILSIVSPKEDQDQNILQSAPKIVEDLKQQQQATTKNAGDLDFNIKSDCFAQEPTKSLQEKYQSIQQVPQVTIDEQLPQESVVEHSSDNRGSPFVTDSNISKELVTILTADTKQITTISPAAKVWCKPSSDTSNISNSSHSLSNSQPTATTTNPNIVHQQQEAAEIFIPTQLAQAAQHTESVALHTMQLNEKEPKSSTAISVCNDQATSISTTTETAVKADVKKNIPPADDIYVSNNNILVDQVCVSKSNNNNFTNESSAAQEPKQTECDETDKAVLPSLQHLQEITKQEFENNSINNSTTIELRDADIEGVDIDNANKTNLPTLATFDTSFPATAEETTLTSAYVTNVSSSVVAAADTLAPLINYSEGQWSPNNPTGKKQYNREQLMKLREAKASRIQPEVNNVSILPQPNLMPSFVRNNNKRVQSMVGAIGSGGGSNNRSDRGDSSSSSNFISKQSSMSGVHARNSMKGGMIHVNLSLNQDVKLNETDNAWRPRVLKGPDSENDPQIKVKREKDELIRRVRGILNKLTPEKFDTLVEEIIKLKINTPDKMEDVMVLVFEKAIDEPNFSVSYARLCHRLITEVKARDERMESGTKTNLAHFRNALLDKTEREFTQNVTQSTAKEIKLQPLIDKIKKCSDPIAKAELEALLEEEERKIRRRSGGTVRFIGELFKISMLTGKIIHSCITSLLNPNSEDMLECMCKLLTTVGAKFEQTPINTKDPSRFYSLEKIIARMQTIASKTDKDGSKVSSRVRFMLQDVIDLRKNKWQSTRNEAPKTMEQIEKEAKTEQLSSQYLNYSGSVSSAASTGSAGANSSLMGASKRDDRVGGGGGRYNDSRSSGYMGSHSQRGGGDTGSLRRQQQGGGNNSTGGGHSNGNNDESTWHVQTGKGSRSLAVDTIKLEGLLTQNFDVGTKKMGGVSQFIWNNNALRQSATSTSTAPSNSFAALSSLSESNKSNDRDRNGPRNKGSYNKGSMESDHYSERNIHSRAGSSQPSRENSSSRSSQPVRSIINMSSSIQKPARQQLPSASRISSKPSSMTTSLNIYPQHCVNQSNSSSYPTQQQTADAASNALPSSAPVAVFEVPNSSDLKVIKSTVSEMIECAANSKTINSSIASCINRIKHSQQCGLLYYILTDFLHLANVGQIQRRYLANIIAYLIQNNSLSVEQFHLAYKHFCEMASDLIVDIPELWLYIFEFTGPLIIKKIITINDLWHKHLKENSSPSLGKKFLKTYLTYCTREIGPTFTRTMWKNFNMKWQHFVEESEIENFIISNKLEYVENEVAQPLIDVKESKDKHIAKVVERVDHLLREGSNADVIIDYINGNIVDIDKLFIRSLTETLCNFAITYKDGSYKLETDCFQKTCIPVLQRYIDSKEERELECLYSMQLLVHSLEHPRGLLSELFAELYDVDVIPQDSFIKWRDSKDQSAGKGVAVKGLNPFFNHVLSGETSEENN